MGVFLSFLASKRRQIGQFQLKGLFHDLEILFEGQPENKDFVLLQARQNRLNRQERLGVIRMQDSRLEQNRILQGLLSLLDQLEMAAKQDEATMVQLEKQLEAAIKAKRIRL